MPPKKADGAAPPAGLQFTPSETGLIVAIFKHSAKPSPDWEAVTFDIGAASAHSCQERFRSLCKKHNLQFSGAEASPRGRKKASKTSDNIALPGDADDGEDNAATIDTPSKKRKRSAKHVPIVDDEDDLKPFVKMEDEIRPVVKMEDGIVDGEF